MDDLINFLVNPNHEAPNLTVILILLVLAIVLPKVFEFIRARRLDRRKDEKPPRDYKDGK